MLDKPYKVFLSFNREDRNIVEKIAIYLADHAKLRPWFEQWELIPGESRKNTLERGLQNSATCAAFVGKSGDGPWQQPGVEMALQQQASESNFRIIPVLLPDAPQKPALPPFLSRSIWVDFRADDDALWQLECEIRGDAPGHSRPESTQSSPEQTITSLLSPSVDHHFLRVTQEIHDLQAQWELLQEKLSKLQKAEILETRVNERFHLEHQINELHQQRQVIQERLEALEEQLVTFSVAEPRPAESTKPSKPARVCICYRRRQPESALAQMFAKTLEEAGHHVFMDTWIRRGTDRVREIRTEIDKADYFLLLLSRQAIASEMVVEEVKMAHQRASERHDGFPILLPIRVQFPFSEALPYHLADYLQHTHQMTWADMHDTPRLIQQILQATAQWTTVPEAELAQESSMPPVSQHRPQPYCDPREFMVQGRALTIGSRFYIPRPADDEVFDIVRHHRAIAIVRGPRQMGKTSLAIRAYAAMQPHLRVVFVDFQSLSFEQCSSLSAMWRTIAHRIAQQLHLANVEWDATVDYDENMLHFLENRVFPHDETPLLLCLDETDQVLKTPAKSGFFASIRSFYNHGALDCAWKHVRWLLVSASEPWFLIEDPKQSPFNVAKHIELSTFTPGEIALFARRHGLVLNETEVVKIQEYVGGHPYLVHVLLYHLAQNPQSHQQLFDIHTAGNGIFRDHLHRRLVHFQQYAPLAEAMRQVIRGEGCEDINIARQLEAAGLVRRNDQSRFIPLCQLYEEFFKQTLE